MKPRSRRATVLSLLCSASLSLAACGPFGGKNDAAPAEGEGDKTEKTDKTDGSTTTSPDMAAKTDGGHAAEGGHPADGEPAAATTAAPAANSSHAHWTYEGAEGPEHWGDLDPTYESCAAGKQQSPINIEKGSPGRLEDLAFAYTASAYTIVDNGHTIQVNLADAGTMTLDGTAYKLLQFHFHAPSEHQMGGGNYPMEVHLVHKSETGTLAVVGAFIQSGEASSVLAPVFDHMPGPGVTVEGHGKIDATKLLPEYRGTIRYAGSLTTPPCSEGVHWNVLVAPIQLSPEQVKAFTSRHDHSNRPVQELGDRKVTVDLEVAG